MRQGCWDVINGVFLGKDGYLIQNFTEPTEENYARPLNGPRQTKENLGNESAKAAALLSAAA